MWKTIYTIHRLSPRLHFVLKCSISGEREAHAGCKYRQLTTWWVFDHISVRCESKQRVRYNKKTPTDQLVAKKKNQRENQPKQKTYTELHCTEFRQKGLQVHTFKAASLSWKSKHPESELMTSSGDTFWSWYTQICRVCTCQYTELLCTARMKNKCTECRQPEITDADVMRTCLDCLGPGCIWTQIKSIYKCTLCACVCVLL